MKERIKKKLKLTGQLFKYTFLNKRYPFTFNLAIDYKCNSRCEYCNFWKLDNLSMSKEKIFRIVDEAAPHCFYINLYGGEPLLRKDIGDIIDHITKQSFLFLSITTNGILIKEKIEQIEDVDLIILSLDGPKEYHDKLRGRGTYDKAIEAIDLMKERGIPFILNATFGQGNLKHTKFLLDLCREKKCKISFNMYRKVNESNYVPEIKEYRKAIQTIIDYPDDVFCYPREVYKTRYAKWPEWGNHKCCSGRDFCSINPEGEMFMCAITMEDYERKRLEGKKPKYSNNVFKKGFSKAFADLPLNTCVKCWTSDRTAISLLMNNKPLLMKYVLFYFHRNKFLQKNLLHKDDTTTR